MDPDAALKDIRQLIAEYKATGDAMTAINLLDDMVTRFEGLDDFLAVGGFLPKDWKAAR